MNDQPQDRTNNSASKNKKTKTNKGKVDNLKGLIALFSGVAQNLSTIHDADAAVENKSVGIFAASILLLTLLLERTHTWRVLTIEGLFLLILAILASLFVLQVRDGYSSVTVKVSENEDYLDKEDRDLVLQLISDGEDAFDKSDGVFRLKAKVYKWALWLFALGAIASELSFYIKICGV